MSWDPNLVTVVAKRVREDFDYALDMTPWLSAGDTVASAAATCYLGAVDHSGTMIGAVSNTTTTVTFQVKAGTAGNTYVVAVQVTTTAGDVFEPYLELIVN